MICERTADEYTLMWLMRDRVGEVLEGTVVSTAAFGLFVELETGATGLVHVSKLPGWWELEPSGVVLSNDAIGASYRVGNRVLVELLDVLPLMQRAELSGETIVTDFARNKKALHDFAIEETYEAGIQLTGPEVKSVGEGRANLKESYARVRDGEVFLIGAHISPYANARQERQLPTRDRKLLLHRKEIDRLIGKSQEEGKTLIPLKLYSKNGIVKLQIAVASRKRQYDKRREIAKDSRPRDRARHERARPPLERFASQIAHSALRSADASAPRLVSNSACSREIHG